MMEMLHRLAVTWCLNKVFEKSTFLKLISTLQISVVLDYGKVYFRRICKGIKINESCCYIWVVVVMVTGSTRLFGRHRGSYDGLLFDWLLF